MLVGFHENDNHTDMEYIVRKILNARLFESEAKKWDKSVMDLELQVLSISQFTLYGAFKVRIYPVSKFFLAFHLLLKFHLYNMN